MAKLSNKRKQFAMLHGEAVARTLLEDFVQFKDCWQSLSHLQDYAGRHAATSLFMGCAHTPSDEEKDLATEQARATVQLTIDVVATCIARGING